MRNNVLRVLQRLRAGAAGSSAAVEGSSFGRSAFQQQRQLCIEVAGSSRFFGASNLGNAARVPSSLQQLSLATFAVSQLLSRKALSTSAAVLAEPATDVPVEGDAEGLIGQVDGVVSKEGVTAQELADAAVALTYLGAKGNRRVWGKIFEKSTKVSFDAASYTNFLWAVTTSGVTHGPTLFDLSGVAAALLKSFTPTQLSVVVEALGKGGVNDAELLAKVADTVAAKAGDYKVGELARVLAGFAGAGVLEPRLTKVVSAGLVAKAGELAPREAVQALWALATLKLADKATVDALVKAVKVKDIESGADAAALAWSLGTLGVRGAAVVPELAAALKSSAASLAPAHAVQAAWGLGALGAGDAATATALLAPAAAILAKSPDGLPLDVAAAVYVAATLTPGSSVPEPVLAYAKKVYGLTSDHARLKRSGVAQCFVEDLSEAVARATGARYRPEIAAAKKAFVTLAEDGSTLDVVADIDGTKVVFEPLPAENLSASEPYTPLGASLARAKVLEAQKLKVVLVPYTEWAALKDGKAKAAYVLKAAGDAGVAKPKLSALQKKLDEPFDPYA